jgi:hypothetical protein
MSEKLEPLSWPFGSWYAVPTQDQAGVLDALALTDPVPMTMTQGLVARSCWHTYVSPALNGWTLVFTSPDSSDGPPLAERPEKAVIPLSRRFGAALWFCDIGHGEDGWGLAWHGTLRRSVCLDWPEGSVGEPLPEELDHLRTHLNDVLDPRLTDLDIQLSYQPAPLDERFEQLALDIDSLPPVTPRFRQERNQVAHLIRACWCDMVYEMSSALSIDPRTLGPHTHVEGHGVLAMTAEGRRRGQLR